MADKGFTFWANMKEAIDVFEGNPVYQFKLYDALTEYGLYGVYPEDDGSLEAKNLIMFVQTLAPSLEKSSGYFRQCAEGGSAGGRRSKVTDEQIESAIESLAVKNGKVPTRAEIVEELNEMYGIKVDAKTVSRRCPDERKKQIVRDKIGTEGQNGDKINVPAEEKWGQNRDMSFVPEKFEF